jgi:hypothetical protein
MTVKGITLYTCGWCGVPCMRNGKPLNFVLDNWNPHNHEHLVGWCCREEMVAQTQQYVTREMALDAGYPEMEGMPI